MALTGQRVDDAALATDRRTGVRREAELFGSPGSRILGLTSLPAGSARAGVVICSPVFKEARTNYRREVLLSLALARAGIAAQRFQYRGTGNSGGDPFLRPPASSARPSSCGTRSSSRGPTSRRCSGPGS